MDARRLTSQQMRRDRLGVWFEIGRAKTGKEALATLTKRSEKLLPVYVAQAPAQPLGTAPLFRNRSGRAYSKDTLGDDFRAMRTRVFGKRETRQLADFRRSGTSEALAGDGSAEKLSNKMANSLSTSNFLHDTYAPTLLALVRDVDESLRNPLRD